MEGVGRIEVESIGKFVEHKATIFKSKRGSALGHGVMDAVGRLEPRVDKIKDFWRGSCVWQSIYS